MALILALLTPAFAAEDSLGECEDVGQWFQVITEESKARAFGNSLGVTINDFDGDGDNDLYVATGPSRSEGAIYYSGENLLYLNRFAETGELVFDEVGGEWGMDDLCEDRSPMYGDLDNDGLNDLYISVNGRNIVYRNDGGNYVDVTAEAGAAGHPGWGHQGFLFDFDRDGFLDVFFTNGPEDGSGFNTLLRNQADGTFQDVSVSAGVAGDPSGKGACVLDADGDGWQDIFVATGREYGNHLFMNLRDGTFRDEALERGLSDPLQRFGVGANCEDMDNDGDPDILLITHDKTYTGNQLFQNEGGSFVDVASSAGVVDWVDGHGSALIDLDLDGYLDIVMSGIRTLPYIFHNNGDMTFSRLCGGAGITQVEGLTWAAVGGDLNGDAYPEVYISHGLGRRPRENELFLNVANSEGGVDNNWLTVEVQGVTHNPSALGAKVEVEGSDGVTRTRWVGAWSSFDSQGPLPITFGMGQAALAETVTVTFTNGQVQTFEDVAVNQQITVIEETDRADDDADGVPDEWDICPGTRLGRRTDGEGCAVGQRAGAAAGLVYPAQDEVLTEAYTFQWDGELSSAVLQVSLDGTFGPAGRLDYGPVSGNEYALSGDEWTALQDASDGTVPLLWRIAGVGADGGEVLTEPRRFHVAIPTTVVDVPEGANIFAPSHVIVEAGTTVTWWNNSVSAGNLQNEPHDVQLIDPDGRAATHLHDLNGAGFATWIFNDPGVWHYLCHRHSGVGTHDDAMMEGTHAHRAEGPYRCMAGTVTVQ